MMIGSERKQATEKRVRSVPLQPSTAKAWVREKLAPVKVLTREERRAKAKRDAEFRGAIKDLWEN